MFTCTVGWLPAVVNHLLICLEGCRLRPQDISPETTFIVHAVSYVLIILKSFTNPLIFALRQQNIRGSIKRLLLAIRHCDKRRLRYSDDSRTLRMMRLRTASARFSSSPTIASHHRPLLMRQQSNSTPNVLEAAKNKESSLKFNMTSPATSTASTYYCSGDSLRNKVLLMQTEAKRKYI